MRRLATVSGWIAAAVALVGMLGVSAPATAAADVNPTIYMQPKIVETGANDSPEPASSAGGRAVASFSSPDADCYRLRVHHRARNSSDSWVLLDVWDNMCPGQSKQFTSWWGREYRATVVVPGQSNVHGAVSQYNYSPVFVDQFSGSTLDKGKWDLRPVGNEFSSTSYAAASVGGGTARLSVLEDPAYNDCPSSGTGANCHVLTASLGTRSNFTVTPATKGKPVWIAARMKMHKGRGSHDALWTQSVTGYAETGGEMDIAEWFGVGSNERLWHNTYWGTGPDPEDPACSGGRFECERYTTPLSWLDGETWYDSYHIFALRWDEGTYRVYIDGTYRHSFTQHAGTDPAYPIISNNVTDWENDYIDWSKIGSDYTTHVDWVQAWSE